MPAVGLNRQQSGLTLLEVLIAISIFALIGVASFQVLTSVIQTQKVGEQHSAQLGAFQKALTVIDRDLQQFVDRPVRRGQDNAVLVEPSLSIQTGDYPLELTRGGWANPLLIPRSALQRVAYTIGEHPQAKDPDSVFYGDEQIYLLRYFWPGLDLDDDVEPLVQALLPGVEELQIALLTNKGLYTQWPPKNQVSTSKLPEPKALEFSFYSSELGMISRAYKIETYQQP